MSTQSATSSQSGTDLCRVTLAAPRVSLDVALPTAVSLASLLPTLLTHVGEDAVEEGTAHGGWAVQRLGESPLDTERSVATLGIRDGEVLFLRPRLSTLPAVALDDPVEAIGQALRAGGRRWTTDTTRTFSLLVAGVLLPTGAAAALLAGPPWEVPAAACGATAAVLIVAAGLVSRAFLPEVGTVLGLGATCFAAVGGLLALAGHRSLGALGAPQVLVALTAALVAAVAVAAVLDRLEATLLGVATASVLAASGALVALTRHALPGAGVGLAVTLAVTPWLPRISYRRAGLPQPGLPLTTAELRQHGEPLSGEDVGRRTRTADGALSALAAASTTVVVGCEVVLLRPSWSGDEWAAMAMCAVGTVLLLLRARLFSGVLQRLWLLGGGVAGTMLLVCRLVSWFGSSALPALLTCVLLGAGTVVGWAERPGRRVSPPWARAGDVLELTLTLALVPLVLELLGVYHAVRSLNG